MLKFRRIPESDRAFAHLPLRPTKIHTMTLNYVCDKDEEQWHRKSDIWNVFSPEDALRTWQSSGWCTEFHWVQDMACKTFLFTLIFFSLGNLQLWQGNGCCGTQWYKVLWLVKNLLKNLCGVVFVGFFCFLAPVFCFFFFLYDLKDSSLTFLAPPPPPIGPPTPAAAAASPRDPAEIVPKIRNLLLYCHVQGVSAGTELFLEGFSSEWFQSDSLPLDVCEIWIPVFCFESRRRA